jgi:DNA-binding NtrC family response regulator
MITKVFGKVLPDVEVVSTDNLHDAGELLMLQTYQTIFLDLNVESPLDGEMFLEVLDEMENKTPVMVISSDRVSTDRMIEKFPNLNLVPFGKTFNTTNIQLSVYQSTSQLKEKDE